MPDAEGAPVCGWAPSIAETHVGMVVLVGDRAYKSKKPVRTAFLDFSTPERRTAALRRELRLNRRISPDVYLGLGRFSGPDQPDETVLVMRRMPADRRLSTLVLAGAPVRDALRDLARLVAAFHTRAGRGPGIAVDGTAAALRARWRANVAELACYQGAVLPDGLVDEIGRLATRFVDGRAELLTGRCADGWVVDGHGDLIADDVFCLPDGPRVLDCLDFDDHLRHVDALDDVAFLAMDLERLGRADLGAAFLDAYAEFSGDPAPASLRHHYIAYRALVRAKVACLRHDQTGAASDAGAAVRYAELARAHLRNGAVRLALVGGLPGTGKSTVAGVVADRCGAVLLSSDRVRKELAGLDPADSATAGFQEGLYSADHTEALYRHLLRRAETLLARGESVVLDASWTSGQHRAAAAALAARSSSDLLALECRAPAAVAAQRIHNRGATASDATAAIAAAMAAVADPWPDAVVVDTTAAVDCCVADAVAAWNAAPNTVLPRGLTAGRTHAPPGNGTRQVRRVPDGLSGRTISCPPHSRARSARLRRPLRATSAGDADAVVEHVDEQVVARLDGEGHRIGVPPCRTALLIASRTTATACVAELRGHHGVDGPEMRTDGDTAEPAAASAAVSSSSAAQAVRVVLGRVQVEDRGADLADGGVEIPDRLLDALLHRWYRGCGATCSAAAGRWRTAAGSRGRAGHGRSGRGRRTRRAVAELCFFSPSSRARVACSANEVSSGTSVGWNGSRPRTARRPAPRSPSPGVCSGTASERAETSSTRRVDQQLVDAARSAPAHARSPPR